MESDWNQRYLEHNTPWDSNQPSAELQRVLDEYSIAPCRALDLGCGTGVNAVHLASRGFDVTAIDIAPTALQAARDRAASAGVKVRFLEADALNPPDPGRPFDFIFDRGCYHHLRQRDEPRIVSGFDRLLSSRGHLLILSGNANEADAPQEGPPRVSAHELVNAFGAFRILLLREFQFDIQPDLDYRPLGWSLLMRKK